MRVLFLTDTRCTGKEVAFWKKLVKRALGPRASIFMAPVSPMSGRAGRPRVVGCVVILNDHWGGRQCDWFVDETVLGLVLGVYLSLRGTKLLAMCTYWPIS